ncbi:MAG: FAD-dependent thymidylate synthase [Calditrichia bacterium]
MKVILAGYNVDVDTLNEYRRLAELSAVGDDEAAGLAGRLLEKDFLTPETISAAYARISRNPRPVNELRHIAREEVDKARKSNRNIIFGLGHSSVAEHAAFNFDVLNISRLAVEAVEHFRLASYTEKSQRYILFKGDYIVPEEIRELGLAEEFQSLVEEQNKAYHLLYEKLHPYFFNKYPEMAGEQGQQRTLEGWAKEDARYAISLATHTQLGMTLNARSLENMISKCAAHPLAEVREFAGQLSRVTEGIAPSLIKYTQPTDYLRNKPAHLKEWIAGSVTREEAAKNSPEVELLNFTPEADRKILALALFRFGGLEWHAAEETARNADSEQLERFYREVFRDMNPWDSVLREFEFVEFTFQLIVSASNFGQLKRHRMANLLVQPYRPELGITVPPSISEIGMEKLLQEIAAKSAEFYAKVAWRNEAAAEYALTNAHRRRVVIKMNLRELYHFMRLRMDAHAQWDIRETAQRMYEQIVDRVPLAAALMSGKDRFEEIKKNFFRS